MENGQRSLLDLLTRKQGGRKPKRPELKTYRCKKGRWINYIDEARNWKERIKTLSNEMFSANISEVKGAYLEQIRTAIRASRPSTLRKVRGMYKPENPRVDVQA